MTVTANSTLPSAAELEEARHRYDAVLTRIARAADRAHRPAEDITLVGVAKRQPPQRILAGIAAGLRVIGQSYIQEARDIRPLVEAALAGDPSLPQCALEWRMVGRLQRNKTGLALRLFDAIETVDRPELIQTLSRKCENAGQPLDVLIQVSLCGEPQKGGCQPDAIPPLAQLIAASPGLRLRGLMTIPGANSDPEAARPPFRALRVLAETLGEFDPSLDKPALSMGMSGDLEVAVEEGATL
ncbi:MAG: YggS family pyridoxal phosphate-dependent enzyme, partial [Myxococcota bacterium]